MRFLRYALLCGWLAGATLARADHLVWWEGENPAETNFPKNSSFAPATFPETRELLSNGNWLSADGPRRGGELFARYSVQVPVEATYDLWVRKFWNHGPFQWQFDQGPWTDVGTAMPLADNVALRTFVCANWVYLGEVKLSAGGHAFEIRLRAGVGEKTTSAFDCFVLTDGPFVPNGKSKPGGKIGKSEPGYFPFEPSIDAFTTDALLDLRGLNEKIAGENGFVRKNGNDFALAGGKPVRFWGVNCSIENARQNPRSVDYLARRLAKAGVNLVRLHGKMWHEPDLAQLDPNNVRDIQRFVRAMKQQGIYTSISFYFPLWFDAKDKYGLAGFDANQNKKPFALLFFNPKLQELHRGWLKQLLTTPGEDGNPPLGGEPAVAMVELQNEDSMFFWTFGKKNVPPPQWEMLEERYNDWLMHRYGVIEKAWQAWGEGARGKGDRNDRAQVLEIWQLTAGAVKNNPAKARRAGDQARFMAELQKDFYDRAMAEAREKSGAKNLFVCSNWITADASTLDAIERWTYTGGDVTECHGYFGGKHEGDGSSYSVRVGHKYQDAAGVLQPEKLPIRFFNTEGFPMRISEIGWTEPNHWRADATFLTSAYGSLQGLGAMDWFIVGGNYLQDAPGGKFNTSWPSVFGTFPATALLYRQGLVQRGPDVLHTIVPTEDLFAMKGSAAPSSQALEELRKQDIPPGATIDGEIARFDGLAFYVGRVVREFGDDPSKSRQIDVSKFIDREKKIVRSVTGELSWDYGNGLASVNAPAAQGVAGFLKKAGRVELADVVIESNNDYGQILVVALDGKPIAQSRKLLVQAMTDEKALGEKSDGGVIQALGMYPPGVRLIEAGLRLKSWDGQVKVQKLDENGYAVEAPIVSAIDHIKLPENSLHCVIMR